MTYVICEPCIGVKAKECQAVCPVDCIHGTDEDDQLFINPDECIECGSCAAVCPVGACIRDEDVPDHWKSYIEKNAWYYQR